MHLRRSTDKSALSEYPDTSTSFAGSNSAYVVLFAFVIVSIAMGAYVYVGQKPPVAAGAIEAFYAYPVHHVTQTTGANGVSGEATEFNQVFVLAQVKLHNQSQVPLFLHDLWGTLSMGDSTDLKCSAASRTDVERAYIAYPELPRMSASPLPRDLTLQPGDTSEFVVLLHYPITKDEWDKRTSLDVVISFEHQKNLTLRMPQ